MSCLKWGYPPRKWEGVLGKWVPPLRKWVNGPERRFCGLVGNASPPLGGTNKGGELSLAFVRSVPIVGRFQEK